MIAPFSKFGSEACPLQQKGEGGGGEGLKSCCIHAYFPYNFPSGVKTAISQKSS